MYRPYGCIIIGRRFEGGNGPCADIRGQGSLPQTGDPAEEQTRGAAEAEEGKTVMNI